jgi:hypothetical protein
MQLALREAATIDWRSSFEQETDPYLLTSRVDGKAFFLALGWITRLDATASRLLFDDLRMITESF